MGDQKETCGKFEVKPLPYRREALEPYIDTETVTVHHDVLYQKYVDKLNAALADDPQYACYSLEELLLGICYLPKAIAGAVYNQAGGAFNHQFYFDCMRSAQGQDQKKPDSSLEEPTGVLAKAIRDSYGNFAGFQKAFKEEAMSVFGSGWTWLCVNMQGELEIVHTANQVTPLTLSLHPVICIDVWEHAYFLQYLAARDEYIDGWFHVANWSQAEKNYEMVRKCYR